MEKEIDNLIHAKGVYDDETLEVLWRELEDIPFVDGENDIVTDKDWFVFPKGTERNEIWHWFDELHSKGIYYLVYELGK